MRTSGNMVYFVAYLFTLKSYNIFLYNAALYVQLGEWWMFETYSTVDTTQFIHGIHDTEYEMKIEQWKLYRLQIVPIASTNVYVNNLF